MVLGLQLCQDLLQTGAEVLEPEQRPEECVLALGRGDVQEVLPPQHALVHAALGGVPDYLDLLLVRELELRQ